MLQQFAWALLISVIISAVAYWRGSLSRSGVWGALIVGICTFGFGGWVWGLVLGVFFVSSTLLSHFKAEAKKRIAQEKFDKTHQRDFGQALANGGVGALIAVLSAVIPAPFWFPLFVGAIATVNADTWATELGTLAKRPPRLITTGRIVEPGTSGGISLFGTGISLIGGLVIGLAAGLLDDTLGLVVAALVGSVGGLGGSLVDSLLGATVQATYYSSSHNKETERPLESDGTPARHVRGWHWLTNDWVNALASCVGAILALGTWFLL